MKRHIASDSFRGRIRILSKRCQNEERAASFSIAAVHVAKEINVNVVCSSDMKPQQGVLCWGLM